VRRLVVALSRARLGLYIVAKKSLFINCYELSQSFSLLNKNSETLQLFPKETYSKRNDINGNSTRGNEINVQSMQHLCEFVYNKFIDKMGKMAQEKDQKSQQNVLMQPRVELKKEELVQFQTTLHIKNQIELTEEAE